ncbi:hypothetical protein, variant [Batrachochytrium dendrobatidis JEL423]|nr:component of the polarisome, variant 2 [Batrachochytrium dendrobatidis]OAJ38930.1 hypothetical protein, variant [Batrachochytrium dendrobatidis JEL423]
MELASLHYATLHEFLLPHLDSLEHSHGQSKQRAIASDKLSKLTIQQFFELSVDVFDELKRRTSDSGDPFLPISNDFHPKRNQARQKLAVLPLSRFRTLASDVHSELDFRFPTIATEIKSRYATGDTSNASNEPQSVPKKLESSSKNGASLQSLSSEKEPSQTPSVNQVQNGASTKLPANDGKASLENLMSNIDNMMTDDRSSDNYKSIIISLQTRLSDLEAQLENERTNKAAALMDADSALRREKQKYQELDKVYQEVYSNHQILRQDYNSLQDDYNEQQQISADIRSEATNLLEEIKELSIKNEELRGYERTHLETIQKLKEEIKRLDSAGSRSISHDFNSGTPVPASSNNHISPPQPFNGRVNIDYDIDDIVDAGIVSLHFVDSYKNAVDDLVSVSGSENPTSVLVAMKGIVIACRSITEDSEAYENNPECALEDYERNELVNVKNKLSAALTHQMGIAKSLATNFSLNTVASLEAATSDLSATIVELLHIYQRHTGLSNAISRTDEDEVKQPGDFGSTEQDNFTGRNNNGINDSAEDGSYEIEELKIFLEQQTDLIVQAIQSLLNAMRQSSSFGQGFKDTVGGITSIVDNLVDVSRDTLNRPPGAAYRANGGEILKELAAANIRLDELGTSMINSPQSKALKQKLASSSYEIAKFVKELISLIE